MQKWNHEKREYESYAVPSDWKVSAFEADMDTVINCAQCGKEMTFGEGYTSREIHSDFGMGYAVCEQCYSEEWKRERSVK